MKTEPNGGPAAEGSVERRLARLYDEELDRAERDFPTMRTPLWDAGEGRLTGRRRLRLAAGGLAAVAVAAVVVAGGWLAFGPQAVPAGPAPAGGIPNQIDGQRVYRMADRSEWQNLGGSFLLAATPSVVAPACDLLLVHAPSGPAERDLIQTTCGAMLVGQTLGSGVTLAPKGALVEPWDGSTIVMRVHTHDSEAAQCGADTRAQCEASVVVEAVVWPTIPTQIDVERVYRASDQASFAGIGGSFLLGGRFTKPEFVPPCPMQMNETQAEQQLIPYCYLESIDGLDIAPMSNIDEPRNELVVARVHVDDPLAAQCPATDRAECQASIVVESVVWQSDALINASPSNGSAGASSAASAAGSAGAFGGSSGVNESSTAPSPGVSGSDLVPPPPAATPPMPPAS